MKILLACVASLTFSCIDAMDVDVKLQAELDASIGECQQFLAHNTILIEKEIKKLSVSMDRFKVSKQAQDDLFSAINSGRPVIIHDTSEPLSPKLQAAIRKHNSQFKSVVL